MSDAPETRLLVSILSFGEPDNVVRLLDKLPTWLTQCADREKIGVTLVVRNNDPTADMSAIARRVAELAAHLFDIKLIESGRNLGFAGGHNANFRLQPADVMLVLNDDITFPDLDWLGPAIRKFAGNPRLALIADAGSPQYLGPFFANGMARMEGVMHPLRYGQGSVLLLRGTAFAEIGMFDELYEWALFEDVDLSLRLQSAGFELAWIDMPHRHRAGSSFNALPAPLRTSIQEHNRARFFARWQRAIETGIVGKFEVLDLWSDNSAAVFHALPHLLERANAATPLVRGHILVNTPAADLARLALGEDLRIVSVEDPNELVARLREPGIAGLRSLRYLNLSLPFHIEALVAGTLSLPPVSARTSALFADALRRRTRAAAVLDPPDGDFCAFHVAPLRDRDGGSMSEERATALLRHAVDRFGKVALVGNGASLPGAVLDAFGARVVDLQGRLGTADLIALLAAARWFVGIDSFSATVAQAFGIPCAIFFGSVHPLTRVQRPASVWPLCADLACLGCSHLQVEPGPGFCMRRDHACAREIPDHAFAEALADMEAGRRFDWSRHVDRLNGLQARFVALMAHHPGSPSSWFGRRLPAGEVSRLIYEMTDKVAAAYERQRPLAALRRYESRLRDLEAELGDQIRRVASLQNELDAYRRRDDGTPDQNGTLEEPAGEPYGFPDLSGVSSGDIAERRVVDEDVRALYTLLLGRQPEDERLYERKRGQRLIDYIGQVLESPEFRDRVFNPFLAGDAPPQVHLRPPQIELARRWLTGGGFSAGNPDADGTSLMSAFLSQEPMASLLAQALPAQALRFSQQRRTSPDFEARKEL